MQHMTSEVMPMQQGLQARYCNGLEISSTSEVPEVLVKGFRSSASSGLAVPQVFWLDEQTSTSDLISHFSYMYNI